VAQLVDFPLYGGVPTWRATALEMGNCKPIAVSRQVA
jgi:hypothetical protein